MARKARRCVEHELVEENVKGGEILSNQKLGERERYPIGLIVRKNGKDTKRTSIHSFSGKNVQNDTERIRKGRCSTLVPESMQISLLFSEQYGDLNET